MDGLRREVLDVLAELGEPATLGMVRGALDARGVVRPQSSLPATMHWLVRAGLVERRGTRRSYVYACAGCRQGVIKALELVMMGWRKRTISGVYLGIGQGEIADPGASTEVGVD